MPMRSPSELAALVVRGITEKSASTLTGRGGKHFMDDWDWYQGVALFGLYRYYKRTGRADIRDYLTRWFDRHMRVGLPSVNVNSVCPLLTLTYLYEESKRPDYLALLCDRLEQVMHALPRTPEGGFQHKTIDSDNYCQLWDDTLYMTVLFVARMGVLLNEDKYIQESVRQFLVHIKYLQDPVSGLFFHGWNFDGCHHFGRALWGRGNAWYTAGLVDYLEIAPLPGGVRDFLLSALLRQAQALERYQDDEGMWHTLIDQPRASYAEASATAGFAYGLLKAARTGCLPARYAECGRRGLDAIIKLIDENGVLGQVSAGTCVGDTLDDYLTIPLSPQPYGQSMALLLLLEAENMAETNG